MVMIITNCCVIVSLNIIYQRGSLSDYQVINCTGRSFTQLADEGDDLRCLTAGWWGESVPPSPIKLVQ